MCRQGAGRILAGVPGRDDRAEPDPPAGRPRRQRAGALAMGRRRRRAPRAGDVLRRAGTARRLRGRACRRGVACRLRGAAPPRNQRPRRGGAVRIPRRHQPAVDRLGAGVRPGDARPRLQQRLGARGVRARLPQRIRQVHRSAGGRRRRLERGAARCAGRRRQEGRRPQRHLPGVPPARAGRPRLLAVRVPGASGGDGRRADRSWRRPSSAARRPAIRWCR